MVLGVWGRAVLAVLFAAVASVASTGTVGADVTVKAVLNRAQVSVGEAADLGVEVQGVQSTGIPEIANGASASVSYLGPASRVSFVNAQRSALPTDLSGCLLSITALLGHTSPQQ